jgi:hypothetical protein
MYKSNMRGNQATPKRILDAIQPPQMIWEWSSHP